MNKVGIDLNETQLFPLGNGSLSEVKVQSPERGGEGGEGTMTESAYPCFWLGISFQLIAL